MKHYCDLACHIIWRSAVILFLYILLIPICAQELIIDNDYAIENVAAGGELDLSGDVVYVENYSAEARALFARMPNTISTTDKANIDTLITSLVDSGYWARMDRIWMMCLADSANSLIQWKSNTDNLVPYHLITHEAYKGFTGHKADSSHLETNFSPKSDGIYYKKKTASIMTYQNSNVAEDHCFLMGSSNAPTVGDELHSGNYIRTLYLQAKINDRAGGYIDVNIGLKHDGFMLNQRTDSLSEYVYFNGYLHTSNTNLPTGTALGNTAFHILNNGYTNLNNSDNRIAFAAVGDTFTSTEVLNLYDMFHNYLYKVGATFNPWESDVILKQGFEGTGYDGGVPFVEEGTVNEDYVDTILLGTQSCMLAGATGIIKTVTPLHGDSTNISFMARFADATPAALSTVCIISTINTSVQAQLRLNTDGKLRIYNGSTTANGSTVLHNGVTYYIWLEYVKGTGANGNTKLYINTENIKPALTEATITTGTGIYSVQQFWWYGTSMSAIYDDIIVKRTSF